MERLGRKPLPTFRAIWFPTDERGHGPPLPSPRKLAKRGPTDSQALLSLVKPEGAQRIGLVPSRKGRSGRQVVPGGVVRRT
jgi:hypothetical protein